MSTLTRYINPFIQYSDGNGVPLKGGLLYTYVSGTSTPLNTYSDSALTVPNSNPIVLDSAGYIPNAVFLTAGTYKYVLEDSTGSNIRTSDPNAGAQATGGTLPVLSGNVGDFGKTIEVTADGSNYQLTTILNNQYTIASALASGGATLTIKDEGAASIANAHPFIQFGESSVVGGTQTNMGVIGFSDGVTSAVIFSGSGLNDATSGGTEASGRPHTYTVIIDTTGTPDKFKWQIDGGSFTTGVSITGAAQTLANGVTIQFAATTGHTLAAQWVFQTGEALNIRNSISSGNINLTTTGNGSINFVLPGTGTVNVNGSPITHSAAMTVLISSQTWTSPSDVTASTVYKFTLIGPGGGGNSGAGSSGGGGGGAGATCISVTNVGASTGYIYTQGAAGTAATAGGTSTFAANSLSAVGGSAGTAASGTTGGAGGLGGASTNGTINITGGDGDSGGSNSGISSGGSGGGSMFGTGGHGGTASAQAGSNGNPYGSGGGGGAYGTGTGGTGKVGILIIERISG